jgi:hypothetical protein
MNSPLNDPNNWKSIGFFNGQSHFTYTFKKAEKITAALYLISSLLKDTEPMKWELREKAVSMISSSIALNSIEPSDKNGILQSLFSVSLETLTLLNIASLAGLISEMNHSILKNEIELIVSLLKEKVLEDTERAGYILSDSFFKTDFKMGEIPQGQLTFDKGQSSAMNAAQQKQRDASVKKEKVALKDKKNDRKTMITSLLQKQSHLTIKDFAKVIQGCSEKTIQRELLELVEKGIIKREGERRWSTYSLVVSK